jgi:hypothetical protein
MSDLSFAIEVAEPPQRRPSRALELCGLLFLLGGCVAGSRWSWDVGVAMPGWFDSSEACEQRFGPGNWHAETSNFPVAAQCLGPEVKDYIEPDEGRRLTRRGVQWMVASACGLVLLVWSLLQHWRWSPPPADRRTRRFRRLHLASAVLLGVTLVPAGWIVFLAMLFGAERLGGIPAAGLLATVVGLAAALLDRLVGPYRHDPFRIRVRGLLFALASLLPAAGILTPNVAAAMAGVVIATTLFVLIVVGAWADEMTRCVAKAAL